FRRGGRPRAARYARLGGLSRDRRGDRDGARAPAGPLRWLGAPPPQAQGRILVPRTRSSHMSCGKSVANFGFRSGTRIIQLLVPVWIRKFASEGAAGFCGLRKRGTSG